MPVQKEALASKADILFYGGAAGGGKTDLLLGAAYLNHKRSIIFRREYPQLQAIIDRSIEIFSSEGKFNQSKMFWSFPEEKKIEFGAVQHPGDERKYQGRPHDLKAFDELAHFTENQFRTLCGWMRSNIEGQRCRVIAAGNPPTNTDGDWIIRFFAPWLDRTHPNPAVPGELRYFTTVDGKDLELPNGEPIEINGEMVTPLSRTFIPANLNDNPFYSQTGYKATLQAMPEPLRSKMLYGDFSAGMDDDAFQVIPTEWVYAAQVRWRQRQKPETKLSCLGVDVARGGKDKTIFTPRYDNYFAMQLTYPGASTPDGAKVAALIVKALAELNGGEKTPVNIDVIGIGSSAYDATKGSHDKTIAMNGAEKSIARDKSGELGFVNKRAEWFWKLRESLDPANGEDLALPDDRELVADLCSARWKLTVRGIQIESKEDIIKRIGRSPDKGDSLVYAHAIEFEIGDNLIAYYENLNKANERK